MCPHPASSLPPPDPRLLLEPLPRSAAAVPPPGRQRRPWSGCSATHTHTRPSHPTRTTTVAASRGVRLSAPAAPAAPPGSGHCGSVAPPAFDGDPAVSVCPLEPTGKLTRPFSFRRQEKTRKTSGKVSIVFKNLKFINFVLDNIW